MAPAEVALALLFHLEKGSAQMRIAMLTAGGLAPCLSTAVGGLIERYAEIAPTAELIGYKDGYAGLLTGNSINIGAAGRAEASALYGCGGSPLGNSRVKLTNVADCVKRGLVKEGQDPLHVAAEQLTKDGINVLHTIGGDDTNITAADLAAYLASNNYELRVVGLPKTIDNDVFPIAKTLGAATAAEQGAIFFENLVYEGSANPRSLIIHEVMGRNCGWLTAATAQKYRERLATKALAPSLGFDRSWLDIDAIYIPEVKVDIAKEAERLRKVIDRKGTANVFVSEGAGVEDIVASLEAKGEVVERDAFGHVKLDKVNVGSWFSKQFATLIAAEKAQVQKSGYFARSAASNAEDLDLIRAMVHCAVDNAIAGVSGVIGHDIEQGFALRAIEFPRIAGGRHFDATLPWFTQMLTEIGQL
jgi:diphosphate-dependent phosphofructokinase